jgi:adenylosuccinate lyase
MESREIYKNLSPLDHRYSLSDPQLYRDLSLYMSEEASIDACVRVELALLRALAGLGIGGAGARAALPALESLAGNVSPAEVYAEEEKTRHNVRALVNVLKRKVPPALAPLVHLGATSADILDTAAALRYRDVSLRVTLPLLLKMEEALIDLARREAETTQIGRTHGQHAVPITFGFAVAGYVARFGKSIQRLREKAGDLRGKLSGAVGAYNATGFLCADPRALEREFLAYLGLHPSEYSSQLVEPEHLLGLLLEMNTAFGILANLADDLRNLQRTEIGEVREGFAAEQVGSSTMPQKRNPWNCEHVKSLWKSYAPRVVSFFMDQISEHQRDLTNSASSRFVAEYVAGFCLAVSRMVSVLGSLTVDRERMAGNLRCTGGMVLAEPAYILLAGSGETEAHERLRAATLRAEKERLPLDQVLRGDPTLWNAISTGIRRLRDMDADAFFRDPSAYSGLAAVKAREIADRYAAVVDRLRGGL